MICALNYVFLLLSWTIILNLCHCCFLYHLLVSKAYLHHLVELILLYPVVQTLLLCPPFFTHPPTHTLLLSILDLHAWISFDPFIYCLQYCRLFHFLHCHCFAVTSITVIYAPKLDNYMLTNVNLNNTETIETRKSATEINGCIIKVVTWPMIAEEQKAESSFGRR